MQDIQIDLKTVLVTEVRRVNQMISKDAKYRKADEKVTNWQ